LALFNVVRGLKEAKKAGKNKKFLVIACLVDANFRREELVPYRNGDVVYYQARVSGNNKSLGEHIQRQVHERVVLL
jgi:hypothetical protein